jgi:hypothetical protein
MAETVTSVFGGQSGVVAYDLYGDVAEGGVAAMR